MKRKHWILVSAIPCLLSLWLLIVATVIWSFGHKDQSKKSDCIIVLGAAAYEDRPSPVFEERIKHALHLYKNDSAPSLVFTGGYGDGASHSESEVAAIYARSNGIPNSALYTETVSRTTLQNLVEAKKVMDAEGLRTAIIVSDPLHLKRASMMAKDIGIKASTSATPTSRYRSFKSKTGFLIREVYFFHHYLLTGN